MTIMSFQSREVSNTSRSGNAQGSSEAALIHNQRNKRKVGKISKSLKSTAGAPTQHGTDGKQASKQHADKQTESSAAAGQQEGH